MQAGRVSIPVSLSFLIIMFMMVIGCGKMQATSVISGTVSGEVVTNDVLKDVVINMTGAAAASMAVDTDGNYTFTNVENGYYTITPFLDGYSFSPTNTEVVVNGMSVTGINFSSKWAGYSVYGAVTGDVLESVNLTLKDIAANAIIATAATNSDGKYALTNINISEAVKLYDVKPSLAGYKFTPYIQQDISVGGASVTIDDFVSEATHTKASATGTYTWNAGTGNLAITWTPVTVPCNWPQSGLKNESKVTISRTVMTWPDEIQWPGLMIWTRTSSTEGDPAGEWTMTDQSGNKYTATFTATNATSGTISLEGNIIACAYAYCTIDNVTNHYQIKLNYQDQEEEATAVSVTGSGISGSLSLAYDSSAGEWSTDVIDTALLPADPFTYTFTVKDSATQWEETSCFVDWPTDLKPAGTITTLLPTFEWEEIKDSGSKYMVQLRDSSYKLIWESDVRSGSSRVYQGSFAFPAGSTYHYYVIVRGTSACPNGVSYSEGSFTYNP